MVRLGFLILLALILIDIVAPIVATILFSLIMGTLSAIAAALVGLLVVPAERFLSSRPPFSPAWNYVSYEPGAVHVSPRSPPALSRLRVPCQSVASAVAYAIGLLGMVMIAVGFAAADGEIELIKGVRIPLWITTVIALAAAVPMLLAAGRRLDRLALRSGEGSARRTFEVPEDAQLRRLRAEIAAAWQRLGIPDPAPAAYDIAAFVAANRKDVLRDPRIVNRHAEAQAARLRQHLGNLTRSREAFERVEAKMDAARLAVNRTRSVSMYDMLDYLRRSQLEARALLLEEKWADFEAAMSQTEQHLQDLIAASASAVAAESDATAAAPQSPYQLLGVTPDMSTEAIEAVVRRLQHIYHPDRGLVQDRAPFQKIQRAWTEIKRQRGVE